MTTDLKLSDKAYAVTWDPETGWNLYIPTMEEEKNEEMDAIGAALIATFMRLNTSEEFMNEQLDWLEAQIKEEAANDAGN